MTAVEIEDDFAYEGDGFHAQIADASPAYIWLLNPLGRIVHVNRAARELLPSQPLPHTQAWRDAWPADCRFSIDRGVQEAQAGRAFTFRTRFPTRPGEAIYLDTAVSAVRDEFGRIIRLLVKAEDVTADAERSAFLNTVIDVLPLALTVKDARTGRYILANRSADRLYGHTEGLAGLQAKDVLPPAFAAWSTECLPGEGLQTAVYDLPGSKGARHVSAMRVATYDDEGVRHIIGLSQDITQRQSDADALRLAEEEARQASEARSAFVSNISHEIRTPLNGVIAGIDLLARFDDQGSEVDEVADMIRTSAAALQTRFEQLLAISELDFSVDTDTDVAFDLPTFVETLVAPYRAASEAKSLNFSTEIAEGLATQFIGDVAAIERTLAPLLDNAVKFTERGEIRLHVEPLGDDRIRFNCIDTGIGFAPEDKEALFTAFHQRDDALSRRFGGLGLGLALARKHARAVGGHVDARPGAEGGATFWFDLPLTAAPEPLRDDDATLHVLVVDDHPTNRRIVELMLDGVAEVTQAQDGMEALEAVRRSDFDVIFMDIQMPGMDGITAVSQIRDHERAEGRPPAHIVMLTANTQPEHVAASQEAGADRHLGKPFTTAGLLGEIQAAPQRGRAQA